MALPTPNPQIQPAPKKGLPKPGGFADVPQLPGVVTPSKVSPVAVVGALALLYLIFR